MLPLPESASLPFCQLASPSDYLPNAMTPSALRPATRLDHFSCDSDFKDCSFFGLVSPGVVVGSLADWRVPLAEGQNVFA